MPFSGEFRNTFQMEVPSESRFINTSVETIMSVAQNLGHSRDEKALDQLREKAYSAVSMVLSRPGGVHERTIPIKIQKSNDGLCIEITNRNEPLVFSSNFSSHQGIQFENQGRDGQVLKIPCPLESYEQCPSNQVPVSDEGIHIGPMSEDDAGQLSRLFYQTYGYDYINEFIYYPERIREMIRNKELESIVAKNEDNQILAHVGLQRWNDNPRVYEASLGVVDPRIKSRGLFSQVFSKTMEMSQKIPMSYCLFDFVTNHNFSQRIIKDYGVKELAIFVGCQSKKNQASLERLGLGADPDNMNRYTLLVGVIPKEEYPFGKNIMLPSNIGETLGFLLEELGIEWHPTPRFYPLPSVGRFSKQIHPRQQAIVYRIDQPSFDILKTIRREYQHALSDGFQYVAVEVPLDQAGIAQCYDFLAEQGFFFAGFVPYEYGSRLALRLQAIAPTRVGFEQIQVSTEIGQKLLEIIKKNYERNRRL